MKENQEFIQLLKKYRLSQCKPTLAQNHVKTKDDLKGLNFDQLNNIESQLKLFKKKQFRKLVRGELDPEYKREQDLINTTHNTSNIYSCYNNYNYNYNNNSSSNYNNNNVCSNQYNDDMYWGTSVDAISNCSTCSNCSSTSMVNHTRTCSTISSSNDMDSISVINNSNNSINYGQNNQSQSEYCWSPQSSYVNTADRTLWQGYMSEATSLTSVPSVLSLCQSTYQQEQQ